jgi:hypothetical protein
MAVVGGMLGMPGKTVGPAVLGIIVCDGLFAAAGFS